MLRNLKVTRSVLNLFVFALLISIKLVIYLFTVEDGTAETVNREKGQLVNRNCECCFNCCGGRLMVGWLWYQQICFSIISEPMFDLFIILCIVLNTLFMTLEHYPQSDTFELTLTVANYVSWELKLNRKWKYSLTGSERKKCIYSWIIILWHMILNNLK